MKFCKDCASYVAPITTYNVSIVVPPMTTPHRCKHPKNIEIDLVTGELKYRSTPEQLRSGDFFGCGKNGDWFEAVPPVQVPLDFEPKRRSWWARITGALE